MSSRHIYITQASPCLSEPSAPVWLDDACLKPLIHRGQREAAFLNPPCRAAHAVIIKPRQSTTASLHLPIDGESSHRKKFTSGFPASAKVESDKVKRGEIFMIPLNRGMNLLC